MLAIGLELELEELELELEELATGLVWFDWVAVELGIDVGRIGTWFGKGGR